MGSLRGAIYNLHTGDLFSVDPLLAEVLNRCEKRIPLDELSKDVDTAELMTALRKLEKLNLGTFYKNHPLIEKLKPAMTKRQRRENHIPRELKHLSIELTSECNLNCIFCDKESDEARKMIGCDRWPTRGKHKLKLEQWLEVLNDAAKVKCKTLQIIGGEPLLDKSLLFEIIDLAVDMGYRNIQLNTNGLLLDDTDIQFLAHHNVSVMMQVYSYDPETHDRITGVQGSFEQMMHVLRRMKQMGVVFSFALLILRDNQDDWGMVHSYGNRLQRT